jgi:hypothetical protein
VFSNHLLLLMQRCPHRNSNRLRLFTSRNNTPVVVRQNDHRHSDQRRIKHPLTGAEEVITIHQRQPAHTHYLAW